MEIKRASRRHAHIRMALVGPSGTGKTYTALKVARGLTGDAGRICVIDTERGSASLYADEPDIAGSFDVLELETFKLEDYVKAINTVQRAQYDVCIIDSLTHAWAGEGGALDQVEDVAKRSRSANSFAAWREVTPEHNRLVDTILQASMHVIVTMRTKTEWVLEEDDRGKKVPKKIGLAPIQRAGMEYEFDVVGDLDAEHNLIITKSRCRDLSDKVFKRPNGEVSDVLRAWLTTGAAERPSRPAPAATQTPRTVDERMALYQQACETHGADAVKARMRELGYASLSKVPLDVMRGIAAEDHAPEPEPEPEPVPPPAPAPKRTQARPATPAPVKAVAVNDDSDIDF